MNAAAFMGSCEGRIAPSSLDMEPETSRIVGFRADFAMAADTQEAKPSSNREILSQAPQKVGEDCVWVTYGESMDI